MTEYEPNISSPQNLVYVLMPVSSKLPRSTIPKLAQNSDCEDSNTLKKRDFLNGGKYFNYDKMVTS